MDYVRNSAYLMYSGGLDSSYQFLRLCVENEYEGLYPVFFNYGQLSASYEEKAVNNISNFLNSKYITKIYKPIIINARAWLAGAGGESLFPWSLGEPITGEVQDHTNFAPVEIENKNLVLYSLLVSFILSVLRKNNIRNASIDVYTGLRNNEMGDASSVFFKNINDALNMYHKTYYFNLHFIDSKSPMEIVKYILSTIEEKDKAKEFITMTASCYHPSNFNPCMKCSKCIALRRVYKKLVYI